jgi:hypothetical protein
VVGMMDGDDGDVMMMMMMMMVMMMMMMVPQRQTDLRVWRVSCQCC